MSIWWEIWGHSGLVGLRVRIPLIFSHRMRRVSVVRMCAFYAWAWKPFSDFFQNYPQEGSRDVSVIVVVRNVRSICSTALKFTVASTRLKITSSVISFTPALCYGAVGQKQLRAPGGGGRKNKFQNKIWRQPDSVSDSQSGGPGFESRSDHCLDFRLIRDFCFFALSIHRCQWK